MSNKLHTGPRIADPDDFFARLIALHAGLSKDQSTDLNCKLILLMANHIGDREALDQLLEIGWNYRPKK
jgi:hypothetical protein